MSEEFNPYNPYQQQNNVPQPEPMQPEMPQPPNYPPQQAYQPQPDIPPLQDYRQTVYPQKPDREQIMAERQKVAAQRSKGVARAFGMVSFFIGCIALMATAMIYFNFRMPNDEKLRFAFTYSMVLSLPALIFGTVSLMKKPQKKLFAILGICFAAVLVICAFITYFIVVNSEPTAVVNVPVY